VVSFLLLFLAIAIALSAGFLIGRSSNVNLRIISLAGIGITVLGTATAKTADHFTDWPGVIIVSILSIAIVTIVGYIAYRLTSSSIESELGMHIGPNDAPLHSWIHDMRSLSPSTEPYMRYVVVSYRKLVDRLREQIIELERGMGANDPEVGLNKTEKWGEHADIRGSIRAIVATIRAMRECGVKSHKQ